MVSVFWKLKRASRRAEAVADPLDRIATVNNLFLRPPAPLPPDAPMISLFIMKR
jgi:hypothetical protein